MADKKKETLLERLGRVSKAFDSIGKPAEKKKPKATVYPTRRPMSRKR